MKNAKHPLLAVTLALGLLLSGCASSSKTVYIPTDRRIESGTNSLGYACKVVPDAVFAEMLVKIQRLSDLEKKDEVNDRLSVPKNN